MTQSQLEREVCRVTGESRHIVRRLGFQIVPMPKLVPAPFYRLTAKQPVRCAVVQK